MKRAGSFCFRFMGVFGLLSLVFCLAFAEEIPLPEQEVRSFSFTGYAKDGKREWELKGAEATLEGDIATFKHPRLEASGETTFTVTSERGTYNRKTAQAHLKEKVLAETDDGATLRTESLDWHGDTRKVSTEDEVVIQKGNILSKGKGAEAHPDLKKLELKEEVEVEMGPNIEITSKGPMELDYTKNIAVFREEVKVTDQEGELLADRMDVTFDPETNEAREIIATGNVRIKRGESISYSEKAIYDAGKRKVTLTGKPKLLIKSKEDPLAADPFFGGSQ